VQGTEFSYLLLASPHGRTVASARHYMYLPFSCYTGKKPRLHSLTHTYIFINHTSDEDY